MSGEELGRLRIDDTEYVTEVPEGSLRRSGGVPDRRKVRAFIPGTVVEVRSQAGDRVERGTVLLLLEAMKMYNEVCSEIGGTVAEVHVSPGERVAKDQLLVELRQ